MRDDVGSYEFMKIILINGLAQTVTQTFMYKQLFFHLSALIKSLPSHTNA